MHLKPDLTHSIAENNNKLFPHCKGNCNTNNTNSPTNTSNTNNINNTNNSDNKAGLSSFAL